jgi:hypothetical protein
MVAVWSSLGLSVAILALATSEMAGAGDEYFKVYTDAPRILLRHDRLQSLARERQRQSERWQHVADLTETPEPGFDNALTWAVSKDQSYARRAIDWAATTQGDARQIAIVLDWCASEMTAAQRGAIVAKLRSESAKTNAASIAEARDRVFAAVAAASDDPAGAEQALRDFVTNWWRKRIAPTLVAGRLAMSPRDEFALYELLHVVRDNLNIDLREDAPEWFRALPEWHILSHYPAPYPAAENNFYIPSYPGTSPPDLQAAMLSRIAALSMVAYDRNAQDSQFLQGWLMQDSFALKSASGAPYEFLWANPYLPGLSYHHMPMSFHDPASGRIALRSSWDDDAHWLGRPGGELQLFSEGKTTVLSAGAHREAMNIGPFRVFFGDLPSPLSLAAGEVTAVVIVGAPPGASYSVQGVKEHSYPVTADRAGNVVLEIAAGSPAIVRSNPTRIRKAAR